MRPSSSFNALTNARRSGFFHADPHGGNLLIRPARPNSRSPYNFEIVLLDHGKGLVSRKGSRTDDALDRPLL